jgi:hypothetical protein
MERRIKPSLRGSWVLIFGIILGPAIILTGRDPSGRIWLWGLLTLLFVVFFLHRLSLVYIITDESLTADSWWGIGHREKISLRGIERTEVLHGLAQNLVGCGHIYVRSSLPGETSVTILAQPKAEQLALELEAMSQKAVKADQRPQDPEID